MTATTRKLICVLFIWAAASIGNIASAQFVLQSSAPSSSTVDTAIGNQSWSGVGVEFQVNQAVSILELGVFDSRLDGISTSLSTYLFSLNSGTLGNVLASQTFSSGSQGVLSGNYRFKDITDVLLSPGTYLLASYGWNGTDTLFNSNVNPPASSAFDSIFNDGGGALSFVRSRWGSGGDAAGTFPLGSSDSTGRNYFSAGNMVVAVVPEPEIYAMMGLGLGLLGWIGRRKKPRDAAAT